MAGLAGEFGGAAGGAAGVAVGAERFAVEAEGAEGPAVLAGGVGVGGERGHGRKGKGV